ncbi:quinone oxidoreductase family protein [Actinoalloteichus hymeniacidonis]|uniref:Zn-dependent oxidoreductase, NADPH:quinone reductase n=1 Tax=Actinoalloteichus hymeniacidonis TaxID=340345 RepID=A0AAC9HPP3_9PSEU|nr:quinone oxidoreductase [Actinoalloteichus hymeniacidonis]AOS63160.1 Zn-dependent oxidoreductase, NADPH:quinone reductase [Actinoalloteichus hymeniacidonis]MBB5908803.1 NADPH2:quinone reductase [Actinoalloteichus hymeniacidonis]
MRAIEVAAPGGPEAMVSVELADPTPGPGEVVVASVAAGVNFIDTYQRSGVYPVSYPFVPGQEGAGRVIEVGDGVTDFAVGDRVAWGHGARGYAEKVVVATGNLVALPDSIEERTAAALMLQGLTAHYLAVSTHPITAGETVLIHAAAGGLGLLLTQLAAARGARVIATVSTAEKEALAREAGAAEVVRYTEVDFVPAVRELTEGVGVDVVYDSVGKDTFDGGLQVLRRRGLMVLLGGSSGQVPPFDLQRLNSSGGLFVTRPSLAHYLAEPGELAWRAGELFEAVASGTLSVRIGGEYPLAEAAAAHSALESRATTGKLLLVP